MGMQERTRRVTICHCLRAPRLDKRLQGNKVGINPGDVSEDSGLIDNMNLAQKMWVMGACAYRSSSPNPNSGQDGFLFIYLSHLFIILAGMHMPQHLQLSWGLSSD